MKNRRWVLVTILALLAITIIALQLASRQLFDRGLFDREIPPELPPWTELLPNLLLAKTIITSLNIILLGILLATYVQVYRKTESKFSLGLIIFTITLLLYALTSNPLLHGFAGFRVLGLGPFTFLPDLFTCVASAILLYLSRQ